MRDRRPEDLQDFSGFSGTNYPSLKIVVSPVRVWVSPFLKMPAHGLVLGRPAKRLWEGAGRAVLRPRPFHVLFGGELRFIYAIRLEISPSSSYTCSTTKHTVTRRCVNTPGPAPKTNLRRANNGSRSGLPVRCARSVGIGALTERTRHAHDGRRSRSHGGRCTQRPAQCDRGRC